MGSCFSRPSKETTTTSNINNKDEIIENATQDIENTVTSGTIHESLDDN